MTTETDAPEGVDDNAPAPEIDPIDAHNPTPAPAGDDTPPADDAGAGQDEAKPRRSAQERINEAVKAQREAERRAEAAERQLEDAKPKPAPKAETADEDPEPDPEDFERYPFGETDRQFVKDLGLWAGRQGFKAEAAKTAETNAVRSVQQADADRRAAFAKDHPDFHDKISTDLVCTDVMADAMFDSENGPAVAYHLANNPAEARRIAALSPIAQIREIGKIEGAVAKAPAPNPIKTASDAPPVPPTIRGAGGRFGVAPDTTDFAAFERLADKE